MEQGYGAQEALPGAAGNAKKKGKRPIRLPFAVSPLARGSGNLVEAAGIEPASESALLVGATCVASVFYSAGPPRGRLPAGVP